MFRAGRRRRRKWGWQRSLGGSRTACPEPRRSHPPVEQGPGGPADVVPVLPHHRLAEEGGKRLEGPLLFLKPAPGRLAVLGETQGDGLVHGLDDVAWAFAPAAVHRDGQPAPPARFSVWEVAHLFHELHQQRGLPRPRRTFEHNGGVAALAHGERAGRFSESPDLPFPSGEKSRREAPATGWPCCPA